MRGELIYSPSKSTLSATTQIRVNDQPPPQPARACVRRSTSRNFSVMVTASSVSIQYSTTVTLTVQWGLVFETKVLRERKSPMQATKTDVREASMMVICNKGITTLGRSAVLQIAVMLLLIALVAPTQLNADEVTDGNQIML